MIASCGLTLQGVMKLHSASLGWEGLTGHCALTVWFKTVLRGEVTEEGPAPRPAAEEKEWRHTATISRCGGNAALNAAIT